VAALLSHDKMTTMRQRPADSPLHPEISSIQPPPAAASKNSRLQCFQQNIAQLHIINQSIPAAQGTLCNTKMNFPSTWQQHWREERIQHSRARKQCLNVEQSSTQILTKQNDPQDSDPTNMQTNWFCKQEDATVLVAI